MGISEEPLVALIYKSNTNSITHFGSENPNGECVIIFSSAGEHALQSKIGGTNPLLRFGYDVVCIQSSRNDWHQSIPIDVLIRTSENLNSRYKCLHGYGSSMGAYGALASSRYFEFSIILALSPQFRIDEAFDTRWSIYDKKISWRYRIEDSGHFSGRIVAAYDPYNLDRTHVDKIEKAMPNAVMKRVKIHHGSHRVSKWLSDAGALKDFMLATFRGNDFDLSLKNYRSGNRTHLLQLSYHAMRLNKPKLALSLAEEVVSIGSGAHDVFRHISAVQGSLGNGIAAIEMANLAVNTAPNDRTKSFNLFNLSKLLRTYDKIDSAIEVLESAILLDAKNPVLYMSMSQMLFAKGEALPSLSFAQKSLSLGARSHNTFRHICNIQNYLGNRTSAIEMARRAADTAPNRKSSSLHMHHLSNLLKLNGDIDLAIEVIDDAILLDGDNPDFFATKSRLHFIMNDPLTALSCSERAISMGACTHAVFRNLSEIQSSLGNREAAIEMARNAANVAPNDKFNAHHMHHLSKLLNSETN